MQCHYCRSTQIVSSKQRLPLFVAAVLWQLWQQLLVRAESLPVRDCMALGYHQVPQVSLLLIPALSYCPPILIHLLAGAKHRRSSHSAFKRSCSCSSCHWHTCTWAGSSSELERLLLWLEAQANRTARVRRALLIGASLFQLRGVDSK